MLPEYIKNRDILLNNFLKKYKNKFKSITTNTGKAAPIVDTFGGLFDVVLGNNSMPFEKDYWRYSVCKNFLNISYFRTHRQSLIWYIFKEEVLIRIIKLLDNFNLIESKEVDFLLFYNFSYIEDPSSYAYITLALRKE